jgi:hypothetical protein
LQTLVKREPTIQCIRNNINGEPPSLKPRRWHRNVGIVFMGMVVH